MHSQRLDLCSPLNFLTVQVIYGDSNGKINLPSLASLSKSSWILRVSVCNTGEPCDGESLIPPIPCYFTAQIPEAAPSDGLMIQTSSISIGTDQSIPVCSRLVTLFELGIAVKSGLRFGLAASVSLCFPPSAHQNFCCC